MRERGGGREGEGERERERERERLRERERERVRVRVREERREKREERRERVQREKEREREREREKKEREREGGREGGREREGERGGQSLEPPRSRNRRNDAERPPVCLQSRTTLRAAASRCSPALSDPPHRETILLTLMNHTAAFLRRIASGGAFHPTSS